MAIVCENTSQWLYRGTVDIPSLAAWFTLHHRPLPWRDDSCSPWGVMVSEVMLQQTPVARVEPVWHEWMARWPTPQDLASSTQADAVIAWGRLGYPRRARRLHQTAIIITREHAGLVPSDLDALLALPGIGDYTARAIRTFAFGIPEPIVDTNVRRVVARVCGGQAQAGPPRMRADRDAVWRVLASEKIHSQTEGAKALMELGAVVCTPRNPSCETCPLQDDCAWRLAGYPTYKGPESPKKSRFEGSDRQVRGIILRELRSSDIPVPRYFLSSLWSDSRQFDRALASLVEDALVVLDESGARLSE